MGTSVDAGCSLAVDWQNNGHKFGGVIARVTARDRMVHTVKLLPGSEFTSCGGPGGRCRASHDGLT